MPDPPIVNENHFIDRDWFIENPDRTCYARAFRDSWTLIVKRIEGERQHPDTYLRTMAKLDQVPEGEGACLKAWEAAAFPDLRGRGKVKR